MKVSYHNTTNAVGDVLVKYESIAGDQEAVVLAYFQERFPGRFSPEHIHQVVLPNVPLTSVRRAITNLTNAGELIKCDEQVTGQYGRPIHLWTLKGEVKQLQLF